MAIQKIDTIQKAEEMAKKMIGWDIKIIKIFAAYTKKPFYVIQCNGTKYLQDNGYVE